jgi:hypothetical protein
LCGVIVFGLVIVLHYGGQNCCDNDLYLAGCGYVQRKEYCDWHVINTIPDTIFVAFGAFSLDSSGAAVLTVYGAVKR